MGYQWRNGRLINDEEALEEDSNTLLFILFLFPIIGLGYLFSIHGDSRGFVVGIVLGIIVDYYMIKFPIVFWSVIAIMIFTVIGFVVSCGNS